jgi:hypothetical protein
MGQSQEMLPPGRVFDYSVVMQAAEHLTATKWMPTE